MEGEERWERKGEGGGGRGEGGGREGGGREEEGVRAPFGKYR